jgi:hypothetical protein
MRIVGGVHGNAGVNGEGSWVGSLGYVRGRRGYCMGVWALQ